MRLNIILSIISIALTIVNAEYWSGNFANFPKKWPISSGSCKPGTCAIIPDPTGNSNKKVLWTKFPAGSCSSACGIASGVSIYVKPEGNFNGNEANFEYEVYFPSDFEFVKGGKLPGITSGKGCSGCTRAEPLRSECFSARFMWGPDGSGYPYLYVPLNTTHSTDFCDLVSSSTCDPRCGLKFNPGPNYFVKGQWNTVRERVVMNTVGQANGVIQAWINGVQRVDFDEVIWRINEQVKADHFYISSFFGGSSLTWAPPADTYALFRNFQFYDQL